MIAEFLYKNPRILLLLVAALVVAGVNAFRSTPRLEDPVLGQRVGVVSVAFPGADVAQVESLITVPMEETLERIPEIKQVRSNTRTGITNLVIELRDEVTKVGPVWSAIQDRIKDVQDGLPEAALAPDFEVFPLKAFAAIIAVKSKGETSAGLGRLRRVAKILKADLLRIQGTEEIKVFGAPPEEYAVKVSPEVLSATGLSTAAIAQQLVSSIKLQPGGDVGGSEGRVNIALEQARLPEEKIGNATIRFGQGQTIQVSEIANIQKQIVEPASSLALVEQKPAVVIGVLVNNREQIDRWSEKLDLAIAELNDQFANDIEIETLFSQSLHVQRRMGTLARNLGIGTAAVAFVVLILMGWRSMIVVGLAVPLSALMVMVGMKLLSIPIHQMSVTGLIVALGLLIDNAIVMVDEVRGRMIRGDSGVLAIRKSVGHLQMPLFGSTLTTALAFLPIATLPGPAGEFVGTIAISVILAICSSFILAMTLIPATNALLRSEDSQRGSQGTGLSLPWLQTVYEHSLHTVFRIPLIGLLLGAALPVLGLVLAAQLPTQFFPSSDRNQIQIEVELSTRSSLESTRELVQSIDQIVGNNPAVNEQHWFVGQSAPTFFYNVVPRRRGTPFYAQAIVEVADGVSTTDVVRELQSDIDQNSFSGRAIVRLLEQGPPFDAPIEIRVAGPDPAILDQLGVELRRLLSETRQVIHTRSDQGDSTVQLSLELDQQALTRSGLDESQLMGQIYTTLEGAVAGMIVDQAGQELPVVVRLDTAADSRLSLLKALPIIASNQQRSPSLPSGTGRLPKSQPPAPPTLENLSAIDWVPGGGASVRINGQHVNEVKAYIQAGVLPSVVLEAFKRRLARSDFVLPLGYELQFGGETEQRSNAVNNLIANAVLLFFLMLLSLVASFRSFRCALIIATIGGFSVGLGPLSLWVFGYPFGFMAIVGTMGLVGVAINDSIVVLAAIRANQSRYPEERLSLVEVVSSCTRHILATTFTTVAGFLPLILGGGGFWPPLAITIAGGVGGATFLALYVVPSLHLLLMKDSEPRINA